MVKQEPESVTAGRQWALRLGMLAVTAGVLTACGGPQPSAPATTLPAPTVSAPETATSAPATAVAEGTPAPAATPLAALNPVRLADNCAVYEAWRNGPTVKAALDKSALWPEVIAQGEKAAAGEPIDTAAMERAAEQMAKLGRQLIATSADEGDQAPPQLARQAMGLTSRLANDLSHGDLDAAAAGTAVAEAKAAIAAYEEDAAARQAACTG